MWFVWLLFVVVDECLSASGVSVLVVLVGGSLLVAGRIESPSNKEMARVALGVGILLKITTSINSILQLRGSQLQLPGAFEFYFITVRFPLPSQEQYNTGNVSTRRLSR